MSSNPDYKKMTVVMLKDKIRKHKAKNCPPYSNLNKAGLIKLVQKLDADVASKKVKKSGIELSTAEKMNLKNKKINRANEKLDKKGKQLISKIDKMVAKKETKDAMKKLITQNPFYLLNEE